MTDFLDFQAFEDSKVNEIDNTEENLVDNVIDDDFIDYENEFNESAADYYAFTNVSMSVEDAMQDSFIDFDYSQEANNYCPEDYDSNNEIIDEFKNSGKKIKDFISTLLIPQGLENIRYQSRNLKNECVRDDELKKDLENDELYDELFAVKEKLRLDLDIQNFKNQCFSVNDLLNKHGLFLRVYELKDKFRYLIKQDSKKKTVLRELSSYIIEKFNRFNIARVEFSKKLRQTFCPINIIYKPVKKVDDIINCFFGEKLNKAFRVSFNETSKIKHCSAWQCYFCFNYCTRKEKFDHHFESCTG